MNRKALILILMLTMIPASMAVGAGIADYLILQNVGPYILSKPEKMFPGEPPVGGPRALDGAGIVGGADHFLDHADMTYEVKYYGDTDDKANPTVQVTLHVGGDSDKWLLHEIEDSCREDDAATMGLLTQGTRLKEINGKKYLSLRGSGYVWLNNNNVVEIKYRDLDGNKPEPIEVIQAYLQKYPSTIPSSLTLNKDHDIQWIKDEMERRLWLDDKWFAQISDPDSKLADKLKEIVGSMNIFLNYREKYYGVAASGDKALIEDYRNNSDKVSLMKKQIEYKQWWNDNKGVAISLTTIPFSQRIKNWWWQLIGFIKNMFKLFHRFVAA